MFSARPSQAALKSIETKIFAPDHFPVAYYASALGLYRFESLMRKKAMDVKYQPFKYHLLAIIRMRLAGIAMPPMSSHKFEKYCEGLVVALQDEKQWVTLFQEAVNILDTVLGGQYARDKAKDVSLLSAVNVYAS